jgi:hypothetical protein
MQRFNQNLLAKFIESPKTNFQRSVLESWLEMILVCFLLFAYLLVDGFAGLVSAGQAGQTRSTLKAFIVVMQEWYEWEPGIPKQLRQVFLHSDGNGQETLIRDNDIVELKTFRHSLLTSSKLQLESFFILKDRYVIPEDERLIIEGYPKTFKFIVFIQEPIKLKIIDCQPEVIPELLAKLRTDIERVYSYEHHVDKTGTYIVAQPLSKQESSEVLNIIKPHVISSETLENLNSLHNALYNPSLLVHVPIAQLENLRKELQLNNLLDESGVFVQQDWGVAKVRFYIKRNFPNTK